MKNQIYVKKQYKDTLFRMLFKEKQNLLELYNAINDTDYKNPAELDVVTLENALHYSNICNTLTWYEITARNILWKNQCGLPLTIALKTGYLVTFY